MYKRYPSLYILENVLILIVLLVDVKQKMLKEVYQSKGQILIHTHKKQKIGRDNFRLSLSAALVADVQ